MTSPKRALDTGDTGRYYTHPVSGEILISVTNVIGECLSKPALVPWAAKASNDKAWDVLPRMVAALRRPGDCRPVRLSDRAGWQPCGKCRPCVEREIKGHHAVIKDTAAELGTLVHEAAEQHVLGAARVENPDVEPFIGQYLRFLDDFGLDIAQHFEATELTVANPREGYAGTLDALIWLPFDVMLPGETTVKRLPGDERKLWLIDYKSSLTRPASSIYDSFPLQLAALRYASEMWLPDDTVRPMVKGIAGAAVLNLRTDDYALIPVPAGAPERSAFFALVKGAKWRHSKPTNGCAPITPDGKPKTSKRRTGARKAA